MKWLCCLFLLASAVGCADGGAAVDSPVPPEPLARQALDDALASWKDGRPPGTLTDRSPHVQVVDSMRRPDQRLVDYRILGEVASEPQRVYLVQLRLENPQEAPKVRFCVVGSDPLWVFRQEELDMLGQWMCAAPEEDVEKSRPENKTPEIQAPENDVENGRVRENTQRAVGAKKSGQPR